MNGKFRIYTCNEEEGGITMGENFQTLHLFMDEKHAHLQFHRPESMNAMDEQMLKEINQALSIIEDSGVPMVFISGAGRAFSAGGDIKTMLQSDHNEGFSYIMGLIEEMTVRLSQLPAVTVSVIHGAAAGLGLSFALASDVVYAHEEVKVAMNFINIGLIPDGGGHYFMAQRLGEVKAKQVIWEGKTYKAAEAEKMGLIDGTFQQSVEEKIELVKETLSKRPLKAMIATKKVLKAANESTLKQTLQLEAAFQEEMRMSADHREGIQAFLEKRKPEFSGK